MADLVARFDALLVGLLDGLFDGELSVRSLALDAGLVLFGHLCELFLKRFDPLVGLHLHPLAVLE